jgi:hypothetical protein
VPALFELVSMGAVTLELFVLIRVYHWEALRFTLYVTLWAPGGRRWNLVRDIQVQLPREIERDESVVDIETGQWLDNPHSLPIDFGIGVRSRYPVRRGTDPPELLRSWGDIGSDSDPQA